MTHTSLPVYQVDAFTSHLFAGNPAAVVPLERWLPDGVMQQIAMENNLSETAFFVKVADGDADYHIRWFTPTVEVPLCGHATLASAYVLFNQLGVTGDEIRLQSKSGILTARRDGEAIVLNFPAQPLTEEVLPENIASALSSDRAVACFKVASRDTDYVLVYDDAGTVRHMTPDMSVLATLAERGVIVTAPSDSDDCDMVSRYFLPALGINEDPVTGYMHCVVAPYWALKTGKTNVIGYQASSRGGFIDCTVKGDRVHLKGLAVLYLKGEIFLPD
ncbi:PhzF family phenazine biosynthesis protein [Thalassospira sp. MCCC 1A01428]|uniref:PhzF family phenazine biosynthesis protein n=1 Tax=Thalassospira sp. MCCC 1A01428 TaxID=1470575 RepID=UPI000A1FFABE|nr:PhzF family phenazine biosynthesis protein [Thalassospira sp. MCCC 1A01428]OSQ39944.1 isomerase [Thalassospira sp. MCCC 1A01428]